MSVKLKWGKGGGKPQMGGMAPMDPPWRCHCMVLEIMLIIQTTFNSLMLMVMMMMMIQLSTDVAYAMLRAMCRWSCHHSLSFSMSLACMMLSLLSLYPVAMELSTGSNGKC